MFRYLLYAVFILGFAGKATPQNSESEYNLESFSYRQGLSDNRVIAIAQDKVGFLWIGTANGLNRYDGYAFRQFFPKRNDSTSLSDGIVSVLFTDRKHQLWVGTGNGICRFNSNTYTFDRFFTYPDKVGNSIEAYITQAFAGADGRIWFMNHQSQLYRLNPATRKVEKIQLPSLPNDPSPQATAIAAFGDTSIWIGVKGGIYHHNPLTGQYRFFSLEKARYFGPLSILQTGSDAVWLTYGSETYSRLDPRTGATQHFFLEKDNYVTALIAENPEVLFVAALNGVKRHDLRRRQYIQIGLPFGVGSSNKAGALFKDRAGTLWIGSDIGLVKYDPCLQGFRYTEVHREKTNVSANDIYEVLHNPGDNNWYAASRWRNAIFVLDSSQKVLQRISTLPYTEPGRMLRDRAGRIWLATAHQLLRFDPSRRKLIPAAPLPAREGRPGHIWELTEDAQGRIWVSVYREGVYIFDPEKNQFQQIKPESGFSATRVCRVIIDRKGRYAWFGTDNEGLWECDLNTMKFVQYGGNLAEGLEFTAFMVQDLDGMLWIGGSKGLLRFEPETKKIELVLTRENGLPNNMLDGGICDKNGDLWWGSGDRLVRTQPRSRQLKIYDYRYGASRTPFSYLNFAQSPVTGELYACARGGFLRWHPDSLSTNKIPPVVVNTGLRVLNSDIPAPGDSASLIRLPYDKNSFSVEFAALNFTLPSENLYQWKLENYDEEWSEPSTQRQIRYSQVPPGAYKLLVKAANNNGVWNETPLSIRIEIVPAFWQTWWFRGLVLALLAGAVGAIYRARIRQVRARERMESEYQQRLREVEMSALRAQMNPHFIFNCLNSINRFILLNQPLDASSYLTKFARLIRLVLDNSKSEIISLEKELETVVLYIEMESARFQGRFKHQIQVEESIDPGCIDIPPMLIQPYVENAIWHGLLHKKGNDGELDIRVAMENKCLVIEITDNGIGRAAAQILKSKSATEHKSHGMAVTAERLRLLSNRYGRQITVNIQDLTYPDGKAAGTRVVLNFAL